jgi:phage tail-like protein
MTNLSNFFFNSLPHYFHSQDSYKDSEGKGLVQRFTEVLQEEAETIHESISNIPQAMSPSEVPDSHLYLLGSIFGNPPALFYNKDNYRKLLNNLPYLLKRKGTLEGLELIFSIIDLEVEIEDVTPDPWYYDEDNQYDTGGKYDGHCLNCFYFVVHITDNSGVLPLEDSGSGSGIEPQILKELQEIIYYMTPINGWLADITINGESYTFLLEITGLPLKTKDHKFLKAK